MEEATKGRGFIAKCGKTLFKETGFVKILWVYPKFEDKFLRTLEIDRVS